MLYFIIPIFAAIIGAYFGSYFKVYQEEKKVKKVRDIAIKALNIIKGYAKANKPYSAANNEFNSKINVAEKRAILVVLHKLGIPILTNEKVLFDINDIKFGNKIINSIEIEDAIIQIDKGHCDNLFFIEVESYFTSNIRIVILRNIAKRFVCEVLCNSSLNFNDLKVIFPKDWIHKFTYGERINICVFKEVICSTEYFDEKGSIKKDKMLEICNEIELGIWDNYLMWDYNAYTNILSQNKVNDAIMQKIKSLETQNISN